MIEQQRKIQQIDERQRTLAAEDRPGTWLAFHATDGLQPFSANGTYFFSGLPRATVTPRRLRVWVLIKSTNTGAHYWTVTIQNTSGDPVATVNTSAASPDTWTLIETTTFDINPLTAAADQVLSVTAFKTGAPGALSITPMFYVL